MLTLVPTLASRSEVQAPLTPRAGAADSAQRRGAAFCGRCGIREPHACAFGATHYWCWDCDRAVEIPHRCPALRETDPAPAPRNETPAPVDFEAAARALAHRRAGRVEQVLPELPARGPAPRAATIAGRARAVVALGRGWRVVRIRARGFGLVGHRPTVSAAARGGQ